MYGVKRVAESTSYALTFGEQAKARRHLEQAQRRLDEVEGMVARSRTPQASGSASGTTSAAVEPPDQELLQSTMQEFDSDTSEGSRLLLAGPTPPDTEQVDEVRTWATEQSERLSGLRSTLPAPDRADESLALLDRLLGETDALAGVACQPAGVELAHRDLAEDVEIGQPPRLRPRQQVEGVTGDATTTATGDACGSSGSSAEPGTTGTPPASTPEDGARGRAGSSATAGTDEGEVDGDVDTSTDVSTDDDGGSARSSTRGSGSADTDERRGDDDGGDSGGSNGSDDVSVPLPLPGKVSLPSVGPLPGVSLGR